MINALIDEGPAPVSRTYRQTNGKAKSLDQIFIIHSIRKIKKVEIIKQFT